MALRWFIQRRAQFRDLLHTSGFTASRYIRLMGLAMAELLGVLIINSYILGTNAQANLRPWKSWDFVHSHFKRVDQYPLSILSQTYRNNMWGTWSLYPISAGLFFAFFGFGREAIEEYKKSYHWVRVHIFRRPTIRNQTSSGNASLPSFVASGSMASRSKAQLSSTSVTIPQKHDATFDFDNDSLYDTDERRGRQSVALNDLESNGADYQSIDEKSFNTPPSHIPVQAPQLPMPTLAIPPTVHHLSLSRTSSADGDSPSPTPRTF